MKFLTITILILSFSFNSIAQDSSGSENSVVDDLVSDSKNDLMVVLGGAAAGAVLGLSTLSFVDEPKDHTKNITTGAAVGIIVGVIYVALNQANKNKDLVRNASFGKEQISGKAFNTLARNIWHSDTDHVKNIQKLSPYTFNYQIKF